MVVFGLRVVFLVVVVVRLVVVVCGGAGRGEGVGLKSTFLTEILNFPGWAFAEGSFCFLSFLARNSMAGGVVWKGWGEEGLNAV